MSDKILHHIAVKYLLLLVLPAVMIIDLLSGVEEIAINVLTKIYSLERLAF